MKPNPAKQQHFLENESILKEEVKLANLKKTDKVVEIGAGDGRLTKLLSKKALEVLSFETDTSFKERLESLKLKNVKFIFSDALKTSWRGYDKIVANIPYSSSEPIIQKAIHDEIKELTLIVGEKFAKILEKKETKIGIVTSLYFNVKLIKKVSKKEFSPKPRVDSYLIQLTRKKPSEIEILLQGILEKESKTKNALMWSIVNLGKTKREARRIVADMDLNLATLEKSTKTLSGKFIEKMREKLRKVV